MDHPDHCLCRHCVVDMQSTLEYIFHIEMNSALTYPPARPPTPISEQLPIAEGRQITAPKNTKIAKDFTDLDARQSFDDTLLSICEAV